MKNIVITLITLVFLVGISSCIKNKLDAPPAGGTDPNLTVNFSIDSLKARFNGLGYTVTQDLIISAVVVGDDKSGNLYKQLAIEDSTGGIMLMFSSSGLYNTYPIGRRLFIKLKGLYVGQKNGLLELGAYANADGSAGGMSSSNSTQYIFPGKWGINVKPIVTTIANVNTNFLAMQSELIELDNVEFASGFQGVPYATGYGINLKDCNNNAIVVYTTPGYASFANSPSPSGNGKFICLVGVYNGPQLTVRDTTDISLNGPLCSSQNIISIAHLRAMYTNAPVVLPAGTSISGIVISDGVNGNLSTKNMFIQDATGGMSIRFTAAHSFALGASLSINLAGDSLISFNGGLEVSNVAITNAQQNGTGSVAPRTATVQQINQNAAAWESTLVKITGATINGGVAGTYSGSHNITDGTAGAILYTSSYAGFAGTSFPLTPVTVTCILAQYNGVQLEIRNTGDVQ